MSFAMRLPMATFALEMNGPASANAALQSMPEEQRQPAEACAAHQRYVLTDPLYVICLPPWNCIDFVDRPRTGRGRERSDRQILCVYRLTQARRSANGMKPSLSIIRDNRVILASRPSS